MTANVPMMEIGTEIAGMTVAHKPVQKYRDDPNDEHDR